MKISIITVCYNSELTIEETIQSVIAQNYFDIEHIIVDGCSKDKTMEIVNKYSHRISRIISEPDSGVYDAMNKGIAIATGEVIGILNSDDLFYDSGVLQKIMDEFLNGGFGCVYGNIIFFSQDKNKPKRIWRTQSYSKFFFEKGETPPHPALFVKKKVYNEIGTYKTEYKISADLEFMLRMLKCSNYKSKYVNSFIVKMRIGGISTRGIKSYLVSTKEIKLAWNSNGLVYPLWLYILRPIKKVLQLLIK